ncbi:MAG: hypothetical protein EB153_03295 [Nitrosopumilaceae archaeon]|nr:hypothetical protein [Nitrosopumilaceae archaeon]
MIITSNYINEYQTSTSYYFEEEELNIRWIDDQESYLVLKGNGTYEWAQPKYIESVVEELSDESLIKWYCDEHCCDPEEVAEYIEDDLETA